MTAMLRVRSRLAAMVPFAFALGACGDTSAPPVPTTLTPAITAPATAVVGASLSAGVKVLDETGKPMKGVSVSFEVTGGGNVAVPQATTDATGVATSAWTLGTATGTNTLVARSGTLSPVTFTVEARADAAATMVPAAGNVTTSSAGAVLNPAPGVHVTDRHGNPVQGAQVSFSGSGSVLGAQQTTGPDGIARPASWTVSGAAGVQTLTAVTGSLTTVISVTVAAGPPTVIQPVAGNLQTGGVGTALPTRPAVRVSDAFNNPIAGVQVQFAVAPGGGSITGTPTVSDGNGTATAGTWTLGSQAGGQTLTATMAGGASTTFSATAVNASTVTMTRFAGENTTCPVSSNGCTFTVVVVNGLGNPMPGETVVWTNGAQTLSTTTNSQGRATAANLVTAAATGNGQQRARLQRTGEELVFSYQHVQPGGYNIELRFIDNAGLITTLPASWQNIFAEAERKWESVITGELTNVAFTGRPEHASSCGISHPLMNETVDDMIVWVKVVPIDGPGQVLGSAGPCWIRNSNTLPIVGVIRLDSADVAIMENNGTLRDVVVHEMGHTLGIGSLWQEPQFSLLQGAGGTDPYFSGTRAVPSFQLTGGILSNGVPVENGGGSGTRDSHWRESTFSRELMTGFINGGGANPLSIITIGSLMDLGYQVNFGAADTYLMPGVSVFGVRAEGDTEPSVRLREIPLPRPQVMR